MAGYKCGVCGTTFVDPAKLFKHLDEKHPDPNTPPINPPYRGRKKKK